MADRKKERDGRHKPVSTINLNIPHSFSISTNEKKWKRFKETFHNTGERAHSYIRKKFFEKQLGEEAEEVTRDTKKLLDIDDGIKEAHRREKRELEDALLSGKKFSEIVNEIIEERIKEVQEK